LEEKSIIIQGFIDYLQTPVSRLGTGAEKYELRQTLFGDANVLPMWVADMDLPIAPFIKEALTKRMQHPILGYTLATDKTYQSVVDWHAKKGLTCQAKHIEFTHNVANGFFMAVQAFTEPGDAILVQPPVYPPFLSAPILNGRKCIESPLEFINGRYRIDFQQFEQDIKDHNVKLFLFCQPQNPSGQIWQMEELNKLATLCLKHNVLVISDEIHSSLAQKPANFTSMASLSKKIALNTITLDSPGKVFNLGGLQIGYAIIYNPTLKDKFKAVKKSVSVEGLNLFAITALEAAYSHEQAHQWVSAVNETIQQNLDYLSAFLNLHFPTVTYIQPEASYLVWLNFKSLFNNHPSLKDWLIREAKLGLNDGMSFAGVSTQTGEFMMRMNLAINQTTLIQACHQLKEAKKAIANYRD